MNDDSRSETAHLPGDLPSVVGPVAAGPVVVDTYAGPVRVEWDPEANVTPLGHLAFFIEYLKSGGRFDALVADCPLTYTSRNSPKVRDVLGTAVLGILAGHWRYAHLAALRGDTVSAELLGMSRVVSEDAVRRGFGKIGKEEGTEWLRRHLRETVSLLLREPWILDCDTTIKPLYGHQEGAVLGYNPHKPGRPSHAYHSFQMSSVRLILDVVVTPGNEHASKHSEPHIWTLLEQLPRDYWPSFVRGDKGWGNEHNMARCEQEGMAYLFKLRLTKGVRRTVEKMVIGPGWVDAGKGWEGQETSLRLQGWSRSRRVILLRRLLPDTPDKVVMVPNPDGQSDLFLADAKAGVKVWEFAALVTSLDLEILSLGQLYRDRGDSENPFDELKNQWGWAGFTTSDINRCQIMARLIALVYNWWTLYVRLADPNHHHEALTTRSLLLNAVARQTRHAGQTRLTVTSNHSRREQVKSALEGIARFFAWLKQTAEQLTHPERWAVILSYALRKFLRGRKLQPPPNLLPA
jgi:Transposase DDE domain group 1